MRLLWQTTHQMPEPSGAIALAGMLADRERAPGATAAVIMSGGNCDQSMIASVLAGSRLA
jgi:threonine dehydratase